MISGKPKQALRGPEPDLMKMDLHYAIDHHLRQWVMKASFREGCLLLFVKNALPAPMYNLNSSSLARLLSYFKYQSSDDTAHFTPLCSGDYF